MKKLTVEKNMPSMLLISLAIIACLILIYWMMIFMGNKVLKQKNFTYSERVIFNPLMGFAPRADSNQLTKDINLVYIDVFWSDLEPQQGQYNWTELEEKYQFDTWKKQGKHAVLRFIMDYPRKEAHRDIPDWLYQKTADGSDYSNSYGKGYSPNYSNTVLIKAYTKTVEAMNRRWGQDSFISFIQLGVLGHWGEWHTNLPEGDEGAIPEQDVRDRYVKPWLDAFPHAEIMMRRPFTIAADEDLGLFNDVFGSVHATDQWLDWIDEGGTYNQTGETDSLTPMPDFWKEAPSGGEIASSVPMEDVISTNLSETLDYLQKSHTTFLGPHIADRSINEEGYNAMLQKMGYRLWISDVKLLSNGQVKMTWQNAGVAPFYWDWPVKLYVDTGEETIVLDSNFSLSSVLPGQSKTMTVNLNKKQVSQWQTISLAIQDPMTEKDSVYLAMEGLEKEKRVLLLQRD